MSTKATRRAVLAAFFLSGAAGLMHEVVWSKLLTSLIGATAHAQAVVLVVFMAGLAGGAALFGRRVDRHGRPLTTYVVLELVIAGYALLLPWLLKLLGVAYDAIAGQVFESPGIRLLLRFVLALAAVLLPAILMGGTLPLLARHLIGQPDETRRQVARLYGLNGLGAVIGAGIAGFISLPLFGVYPSLIAATGLNLLAALLLAGPARAERAAATTVRRPDATADRSPEVATYPRSVYRTTLLALGLSGFAAMGYEILFIRVIGLASGLSTYSFTIMLMAFITGISLGSLIVSRLRVRRPLWLLGVTQLVVVIALVAVTPLVSRLPYLITLLKTEVHQAEHGFALFQLGKAALCLVVLLLPTTCLGFGFPLVAQIQVRGERGLGSRIGSTYAFNTAGNVLGTVITSLVLIPLLGVLGAFHVNMALNLLAGVAILLVAHETGVARRLAIGATTAAVIIAYAGFGTGWLQPIRFAVNHLRPPQAAAESTSNDALESFAGWKKRYMADEATATRFYFEEDSHTNVLAYANETQVVLFLNGKPDASTSRDLPAQMFLGHLPVMLNLEARSALIIGHGAGISSSSALRHPLERADVVEISRGVLHADTLFADVNYHVLDDARVHVYEEDGQSFLRATPRTYDVIISQPSNPWVAGIAGLFTVEFFELVRDRLNPGGTACLWFHDYEQSRENVELVLRTIGHVFPHVELFRSHDYVDLMVVASPDPIQPDFAAMERRFEDPSVRNDLARVGIVNLAGLLMHHSMSGTRLTSLLPDGPVNTTSRQRLEYAAPRSFFAGSLAGFLTDTDTLFRDGSLAPDMLLSRYIAYRRAVGEPVGRQELFEAAGTARYLGRRGIRAAENLTELARATPTSTIGPSRPARGAVVDPSLMGPHEAAYWWRRFEAEGRGDAAARVKLRLDQLSER